MGWPGFDGYLVYGRHWQEDPTRGHGTVIMREPLSRRIWKGNRSGFSERTVSFESGLAGRTSEPEGRFG